MTDNAPPPQSGSELHNAVFNPDSEHYSPNPGAPKAQNSDMLESALPEPISGQTGATISSSTRFGTPKPGAQVLAW